MKHFAGTVLAIAGIATLLVVFQHRAQANDDNDWRSVEQRRIAEGFKIAPVHLNLAHKDPQLVGLGSYLVNAVGGCNDCHTNPNFAPGGDPFQGQKKEINSVNYLAGGIAFGPFISRNLTPQNGLPAGHTFPEFRQILRTGKDFDNPGQLLQVMPWPGFQDMSDHDIRAIYEYLSAIPPAQPGM
jgi:mono/diheme cytochrome c family protein